MRHPVPAVSRAGFAVNPSAAVEVSPPLQLIGLKSISENPGFLYAFRSFAIGNCRRALPGAWRY